MLGCLLGFVLGREEGCKDGEIVGWEDGRVLGWLLGWHEGQPVREWLRQGVCAAAANLSDETCTGGIRPLAECLALGERYGFRD